jgi:hypothetical protein
MPMFLLILFGILLSGCATTQKNDHQLTQVVEDYFSVYSQRTDFERFMAFYADNAQFNDIIYGNSLKNKAEIKDFLAWGKGEFSILSGDRVLTVTKQVLGQNTAITEGYFHAFSYDGQKLGPWLFVIIQEFDATHKIIKQTDWINYTPKEHFLGGKNMNEYLSRK